MPPGPGFMGTLTDASLHDVIQLMCVARCTCRLYVKSWDGEGVILFRDGEIIHAESGDLEGEEAFYAMLTWEQGVFACEELQDSRATIKESWDYLLVESLRRFDALRG
jgi:hypothetical protein